MNDPYMSLSGMSKAIKVTLSEKEAAIVKEMSDSLGTSESDIIGFGFRLGFMRLREYFESLEFGVDAKLGGLLMQMIAGKETSDRELEEVAKDTPATIEILKDIRSLLSTKPGSSVNDRAIAYCKAVALAQAMNIIDVQQLANELGVPSDRLAHQINSGGKSHAKNAH